MDEKTAKRIARSLERIADCLTLFADEELRRIARAKARELDAAPPMPRPHRWNAAE